MPTLHAVVNTRLMWVLRRTLVAPLAASVAVPRDRAGILRLYLQALQKYHRRVLALSRADYRQLPLKRALRLQACPPVGVLLRPQARHCSDRSLCPWCWVRQYVIPKYRWLRRLPEHPEPVLLVVRRRWQEPFTVRAQVLAQDLQPRQEWKDRPAGAAGMLRLVTVVAGAGSWRCEERVLWHFPRGVPTHLKGRRYRTDPAGAAWAAGLALRYPLGLLTGGTRRTMLWLRFRKGRRWLRTWGTLYGHQGRARAASPPVDGPSGAAGPGVPDDP